MKTAFSLDELMMFYEVVRAGSLSRASENMGVAKSTLSRRLANLEREMGMLLLKRNTRRVTPTEVGQELYARCDIIQREVVRLEGLADEVRTEVSGVLRVSIPNEFGSRWLGTAISEFALKYPALKLVIDIATAPVNLIEDDSDVAISFGRLADSQLTLRRLALLQRGLFASPSYIDRQGAPKTFSELQEHSFIVTDVQQREGTLSLRDPKSRKRLSIVPRIQVNSMRLAREMVLNGVGLAILPRSMCSVHLASGDLVPILPAWQCPPVEATALVLAREGIPRKTRVFLDFLSRRLKEMEASQAAEARN